LSNIAEKLIAVDLYCEIWIIISIKIYIMKKYLFIFITICLFACQSNDVIDNRNIVKLVIADKFEKHKNAIIVNADSIAKIVKEINKAKWEPAIFISRYKLDLYYKDNVKKTLSFRGDMLKIYGKTYRLNKPIETLIVF
jgi:hypothetical protein